mgnify:CR=1 FL=1
MKGFCRVLVSLLTMLMALSVHAANWPTQTVRLVVPTPAGSSVSVCQTMIGSTPETGANWLRYSSLKAIA